MVRASARLPAPVRGAAPSQRRRWLHNRARPTRLLIQPGSRSPPSELRGQLRPDPNRARHLSFQVASVDALHAWVAHLNSQDVTNSGVYPMEGFPLSLVTFRDPDGVQLELIAFHS
ncbi:VOC family protein [Pseudonocardia sp. Cha107L01]|uniref:VOC family protein n=1 Tax=Pseudonocardia sp. Cha107L01 TaxID=3457576 RepID=UPI00403EB534